jgi:lysophospholipase L1-like esterase
MRTILCYGDSNTWGYDASSKNRFPLKVRWTGVLQTLLKDDAYLVEEGLNGRTTVFEEPYREGRNGSILLKPILESHAPIDLVIVALGANDLKPIYGASGYDSAQGLRKILTIIKESKAGIHSTSPQIMVVTPTKFRELSSETKERFRGGSEKFSLLLEEYKKMSEECGAYFFDSNDIVITSDEDGVHLNSENHKIMGVSICKYIKDLFTDNQTGISLNNNVEM